MSPRDESSPSPQHGPAGAGEPVPATSPASTYRIGDIDIVAPGGALSRGARERKLERVDRYDRRAEVTAYERLTSTGTVSVSFRVVDDKPFDFDPGYFIGIRARVEAHGVCKSPYCISSPPNEDRTFRLLIRLVPEGPLSYYLGGLDVGDIISFRGPSGRSLIPKEEGTELVLLATGVGIGPFLSLLRHLTTTGSDRPVRLYWGLRLVDDVCLTDELEEIARERAGFGYQISLSQPPPDWTGLRGRLTETVPSLLETLDNKHYYLVGNGAMTEEMATALSDYGVDEKRIHQEVYFNVKHRPDPQVLNDIRRRFVASDLFSPYAHQKAGLFMPETPVFQRRSTK